MSFISPFICPHLRKVIVYLSFVTDIYLITKDSMLLWGYYGKNSIISIFCLVGSCLPVSERPAGDEDKPAYFRYRYSHNYPIVAFPPVPPTQPLPDLHFDTAYHTLTHQHYRNTALKYPYIMVNLLILIQCTPKVMLKGSVYNDEKFCVHKVEILVREI